MSEFEKRQAIKDALFRNDIFTIPNYFSKKSIKNFQANPNKYKTALQKSSKNKLTEEEKIWIMWKLSEAGRSGIFNIKSWPDIKVIAKYGL